MSAKKFGKRIILPDLSKQKLKVIELKLPEVNQRDQDLFVSLEDTKLAHDYSKPDVITLEKKEKIVIKAKVPSSEPQK